MEFHGHKGHVSRWADGLNTHDALSWRMRMKKTIVKKSFQAIYPLCETFGADGIPRWPLHVACLTD